jgi:hypothetical protein
MEDPTPSDGTSDADPDRGATERKIRRAITQIRREGLKVATIYAVADAALATLLVNLVAAVTGVPRLPAQLPLPAPVLDALARAGVSLAEPTVSSGAVVGAGVGLLVFVVELALRTRRPLVEQFAAANPSISESLRTARDTLDDDGRSRIVLRLYGDVLDQLRAASSIDLIDVRRVAVTVVLISLISVATIQLAVVDISLAGLGGPAEPAPTGGTQSDYTGLQNGSSILGDPEDVPEGTEELDASIDTSGSGSENGSDADSSAAYADSGFDTDETVESQRAGFSERERLEDAELIREYNLRIRQESDDS